MNNFSQTLTAISYARAFRRRWPIIVILVVLAVVAVIVFTRIIGPTYEADVQFTINGSTSLSNIIDPSGRPDSSHINDQTDFTNILNTLDVARATVDKLPMSDKQRTQYDKRPDYLFTPPLFTKTQVQVKLSDQLSNSGNLLAGGLGTAGGGTTTAAGPTTDFVTLAAMDSTVAGAQRLAKTYSQQAMNYFRDARLQNALSTAQIFSDTLKADQARLTTAQQTLSNFEALNGLLGGQNDFTTSEDLLNQYKQQMVALQSAVVGKATAGQTSQSLAGQIAALQSKVSSESVSAGALSASAQAQLAVLQSQVTEAQDGLNQANQTYQQGFLKVQEVEARNFQGITTTVTTTDGKLQYSHTPDPWSNASQANAYLSSLQGQVSSAQAKLSAAQGSLSSFQSQNSSASAANTLATDKEQLAGLRSEYNALLQTTAPDAQQTALQNLINAQQARVTNLGNIHPQFDLLTLNLATAQQQFNDMQSASNKATLDLEAIQRNSEVSAMPPLDKINAYAQDSGLIKKEIFGAGLALLLGVILVIFLEYRDVRKNLSFPTFPPALPSGSPLPGLQSATRSGLSSGGVGLHLSGGGATTREVRYPPSDLSSAPPGSGL